jgi:SAM-dependent methyltransferase
MAHWTETFFTEYWSQMQRSKPVSDVAAEEAHVLRRVLRLRKGSRVADVPCGDGRISMEFARAGCAVVGVDACAPSVRRARARFKRAGLPGEFHLGDMRDLDLPGGFDAVLNWWGSFGYFDDDTNLEVLRGFARLLRRGGRVLIDQVNRERILRDFMERGEFGDYGVRIITHNRWDPDAQRINGSWTFIQGDRRVRRRSSIRLYTPKQMSTLMDAAGLRLERIVDGLTGEPFTRGSRRMSSIGRRP